LAIRRRQPEQAPNTHEERRMAELKADSHPFDSVFYRPLTLEEVPIS
jgi:hypothetical protein